MLSETPGVDIRIMPGEELPACALDNDVLVEVSTHGGAAVAPALHWGLCWKLHRRACLPAEGWGAAPANSSGAPCVRSAFVCAQLSGQNYALMAALEAVSHVLRENPPIERPGGAPPSLRALAGSRGGGGEHALWAGSVGAARRALPWYMPADKEHSSTRPPPLAIAHTRRRRLWRRLLTDRGAHGVHSSSTILNVACPLTPS